MALLTVCIPTYQREALLEECLKGLKFQHASADSFDILIIDNAGTEKCEELAKIYGAKYVVEKVPGHSQARNRGWKSTTSPWILYLDDDAIPRPQLIETLLNHLPTEKYSVIGGRYVHRFTSPPPSWLDFFIFDGHRPDPMATHPVVLREDRYIAGCVIAFSVRELKKIGGFRTHLGMNGKGIGFGDEDDVQQRLRKAGKLVLYDPDIIVDHLYQPYKYLLSNQLRIAYQHGQAHFYLGTSGPTSLLTLFFRFLEITVIVIPTTITRWVFVRREWFWQNVYLIIVAKYAFEIGFFRASKITHP